MSFIGIIGMNSRYEADIQILTSRIFYSSRIFVVKTEINIRVLRYYTT
jgi:hypothetical protein